VGGLFSDELGIFRVRYEGEVPFSLSELEGADRLRVLTYSASQDLIKAAGLSVGQLEVVLGHPIPASSLDRLLGMQTVALEELQGQVRDNPEIMERIRSGRMRFFLSRQSSHAKLMLVEKGEARFALVGSANFSRNALKGRQMEILLRLEDPAGFERFERLYEDIRRESDLVRQELLVKQVLPEDLPLLEKANKQAVVLEVPKEEVPAVYRLEIVARRARAFEPIAQEVRFKDGHAKLEPKALKTLRLTPPPAEEGGPRPFRVREEEGVLEVLGTTQPFLETGDPGVREDAEKMVAFMEGYLQGDFLFEEEAREQVAGYWRLWAWFWTAPLMHRLLRQAHLEGRSPHAYPLYALVYGKANTGKTTFLKLLSRSLVGAEVGILSSNDLSKNNLRGVHASGSELPTVFDDIDPKDVGDKVEPVLKSLYEVPQGTITPVVLSLNAGQNYAAPGQVRKRALLVWTGAVLDTTRPQVAHRVHRAAQGVLLSTGNRLYRAFLPRLLAVLQAEEDWMVAATRSLAGLLREALGAAPEWARAVSAEDVSEEDVKKWRRKVGALVKTHRIEWKAGRPTLRLGVDARRYSRELPEWLADEVQGEVLVLKKKGLEQLGLLRRRWPWG
jgi:hypothetical protein